MKWLLRLAFRQIRKNLDVDASFDEGVLRVVVTFSNETIFTKTINLKEVIDV